MGDGQVRKVKRKRRKPYVSVSERFNRREGSVKDGSETSHNTSARIANVSQCGYRTVSSLSTAVCNSKSESDSVHPIVMSHSVTRPKKLHNLITESGVKMDNAFSRMEHKPRVVQYRGDLLRLRTNDGDTRMECYLRIQPFAKGYGGMGYARPSVFSDMRCKDFNKTFAVLFSEHVEGFTGKAFKKARAREENGNVLWREKLRAKIAKTSAGNPTYSVPNQHRIPRENSRGGDTSTKTKKRKANQWVAAAVANQRSSIPKVSQSRIVKCLKRINLERCFTSRSYHSY